MKKLRDLIPGYPIAEEFLSGIAQPQKAPLNDYVQLGLKLGGLDYFRGVLKAAFNLFASEHRSEALQPAFDPLRQFVENGSGSMSDFVRWIVTDAELGLPRLGEIDHAIVIRTIGASVEGVVQLFGDIVHPIRLTKTYAGPPVVCSLFVDPLRESDPSFLQNPQFAVSSLVEFDSQSETNTATVQGAFNIRLRRILDRYSDREVQFVLREAQSDKSD